MKIAMDYPWLLLTLVPLFCLVTAVAWRYGGLGEKRKKFILARRLAMITLLCLAMVGMTVTMQSKMTTTVFLVDVSDSMSSSVKTLEAELKKALQGVPARNKVGLVAFGADARVEQFVSEKNFFAGFETAPISTATNLENAVQTGLSMFSDEDAKRLVVITDGMETEGNVQKMAANLKAAEVSLKVQKVKQEIGDEVYIADLEIPEKVNIGDSFQVKVEIESNVETAAFLSLYSGNTLKKKEEIQLSTGTNTFVFQDTRNEEGFVGYKAIIEPSKDTVSLNNEYAAFTESEPGEQVLLIAGEEGNCGALETVLKAANVKYDLILPDVAPGKLSDLNKYKSIILNDVYEDTLSSGFLSIVESYVRDYGGGLIAIGGENSFALGGYKDTVLEKILPVYMDLQGEDEVGPIAMNLVIDCSGSMADGKGLSNLELAKESAVSAVDTLRDIDQIGVLSFSDSYSWVQKSTAVKNKDKINAKIGGIEIDGGTNIYPALKEACEQIKKTDTKFKHVILLTDGQDGHREYADLLKDINENNITLSTVSVGEGADTSLLQYLATQGGGRYYHTDMNSDLPKIFAQEVFLLTDTYLVNREFTPGIVNRETILSNVAEQGLPAMLGYVASTKKETATPILVSDDERPILTVWQYGLGKTVAFNSDGTMQWTRNYANWEEYSLFWKNLIKYTVTESEDENNRILAEQSGSGVDITYQSSSYSASTRVTAIYTGEDGETKEIELEPSAPGTFENHISLDKTGVYSLNVRQEEDGEVTANRNAIVTMQYSAEYRFQDDTGALTAFVQDAGGEEIENLDGIYNEKLEKVSAARDLSIYLFVVAILLFFYDVLIRRVPFFWQQVLVASGLENKLQAGRETLKERMRQRREVNAQKKSERKIVAGVSVEPSGESGINSDDKGKKSMKNNVEEASAKKVTGKEKKEKRSGKKTEERTTLDTATLLKKRDERRDNL